MFERCQDIMKGRNRRTGSPEIPYSGGLFRCGICGWAITGAEVHKRLAGGGQNTHYYYACRYSGKGDHPQVRWRQADLETKVVQDLERMKMKESHAAWFREALEEGFRDEETLRREQRGRWLKRRGEIKGMLERLLNGYLGGAIDEAVFKEKSASLKIEEAELEERLATMPDVGAEMGKWAIQAFDFSQKAADLWHGLNSEGRRAILDTVSLNRVLTDVTLCLTMRKPFDVLVEGPLLNNGRGDWI